MCSARQVLLFGAAPPLAGSLGHYAAHIEPMTPNPQLPLVLMDVDGSLITYPDPANDFSDPRVQWMDNPAGPGRYNPAVTEWVRELSGIAEIRWLTGWNKRARTKLGPALGLPDFQVQQPSPFRSGCSDYKVDVVFGHLQYGRRIVWIDDDIPRGGIFDELLAAGAEGAGLFMVRPTIEDGLTEAHMLRIRAFLAG